MRHLGAIGDGRADDSRAFQAAHDALPGGGTIEVPPGRYRVGTVRISNRDIVFRLAEGAILIKHGSAGPEARGMFAIEGLRQAGFKLIGGMIDLNGEGPNGIGVPGRIPNAYASQTVPTIRALAGPSNAAVFALRSSGLTVEHVSIRNSGENGLLFRNCGDVSVSGCSFENLANYGVEFSLVPLTFDGSRAPMPTRGRCAVRNCTFTDIDDYGLGTGNGVGVGGGGADQSRHTDYAVEDCRFVRCQRDIHFELPKGVISNLRISSIRSVEARQGSLGLIGVGHCVVDGYDIRDAGTAANALLGPRPDIYGMVLSTSFRRVTLRNVTVVDGRQAAIRRGSRASLRRGSATMEVTDLELGAEHVGAFVGVMGGNPEGVCYIGRVVAILSPTRATLDVPAGATVRNGICVIGGATRNGLIMRAGDDVQLEAVSIKAGADDPSPGAVPGAALLIERVEGPVTMGRVQIERAAARRKVRAAIVIQGSAGLSTAGATVNGFERVVERGS